MFPRHQPVPEQLQYAEVQENTFPITVNVYLPSIDSLVGGTNASVDAANFRGSNPSSIAYAAGYTVSSSVTNVLNFGFFAWVRPTVSNYALWSIADNFGFVVESNILKIKRRLYSGDFETITTGLTITASAWNLVRIYRSNQTLHVKVGNNTASIVFYYKIQSGIFQLGKFGADTFTGNFFNAGYWTNLQYYQTIFFKAAEAVFDKTFTSLEASENTICQLEQVDFQGNFTFSQNTATYSISERAHVVATNSLAIRSARPVTSDFTCDLVFSVPNISLNIELLSHWVSPQLAFSLVQTGGLLKLIYMDGAITIAPFIALVANQKHQITLQFKQRRVILWLDGVQLFDQVVASLVKVPSYWFFFNSSNYLTPTSNFNLYSFKIVENKTNLTDFLPQVDFSEEIISRPIFRAIRYRNFSKTHPYVQRKVFDVSGANPIAPNTSTTYTITQNERLPYSVIYDLAVILPPNSDWSVGEVTLSAPTVTVAANALTTTFNVVLSNFAVQKARKPFKIRVEGLNYTVDEEITLNDVRVYSLTAATGLFGYIDGYLAASSTVSGVIPNLTATANANTTAPLTVTDTYGKAYPIATIGEKINLSSTLTNVRSIFFIYRERVAVANRLYVGNSTGYTFNGGAAGEIVGNLVFNPGDYINIGLLLGRFFKVALSADENYLVYFDDSALTVKVVRKNGGIWDFSTPAQLTLGSFDTSNLANADIKISANGTQILIGLKNSGTVFGEGRVLQFTRSGSNTWTNSLTLGSPLPLTFLSGFGLAVAQNTADTKLVISEQNSNIYVFTKVGLTYNTTPIQTINYFARKIVGLPDLSQFLALDDLGNARLYTDSSGYTLTQTFSADLDISLQTNYVVVSKLGGFVEIWQFTGSWTLVKTITVAVTNFGYSIHLTPTLELIIGSPNEAKIYLYNSTDNWTTPKVFTGSTGFGYSVTGGTNVVGGSNYSTNAEFFSRDGSSLPQQILAVRQNKLTVPIATFLDTADVSILQFTSSTALSINSIGSKINGLWLGALFFDRLLTTQEISDIENNIYNLLELKDRSAYV